MPGAAATRRALIAGGGGRRGGGREPLSVRSPAQGSLQGEGKIAAILASCCLDGFIVRPSISSPSSSPPLNLSPAFKRSLASLQYRKTPLETPAASSVSRQPAGLDACWRSGWLTWCAGLSSGGRRFKSTPGQKSVSRFLLHLRPLTNCARMGTWIVWGPWEAQAARERTGPHIRRGKEK